MIHAIIVNHIWRCTCNIKEFYRLFYNFVSTALIRSQVVLWINVKLLSKWDNMVLYNGAQIIKWQNNGVLSNQLWSSLSLLQAWKRPSSLPFELASALSYKSFIFYLTAVPLPKSSCTKYNVMYSVYMYVYLHVFIISMETN